MPKLTMTQIARANNFAIAYNLDPREFTEALQKALEIAAVMAIPQVTIEDFIYGVFRGPV